MGAVVKRFLSCWKAFSADGDQSKRFLPSLKQRGEWSCYGAEVAYESPVEIGKAQKSLQFFHHRGLRPIQH